MSYLDVRNQLPNCRLQFRGFKIKNTILSMFLKIENSHEAISKEFRDLKARSKVGMKHFKVKLAAVWYV